MAMSVLPPMPSFSLKPVVSASSLESNVVFPKKNALPSVPAASLSGMNEKLACVAGQTASRGVRAGYPAHSSHTAKWRENALVEGAATIVPLLERMARPMVVTTKMRSTVTDINPTAS
jgi:hypothetical protein